MADADQATIADTGYGLEHTIARTYADAAEAGIAAIPAALDGSKRPMPHGRPDWKLYQTELPAPEETDAFAQDAKSIGVVTGHVSRLDAWDFDCPIALAQFEALVEAAGLGPVWERLKAGYCDRTPSGGLRVLVRWSDDIASGVAS